ncbi:outer membrane lipoprotein-sorting protein [Fulvivirga ulvae]|uniref:outer membrane lipoprotein-sorting protein n=1 Tax=Fulvivirga ulvae TaxID=2904245 RepID=UPI001F414DD3|nr:outer membrane lipoprotein-sorting protein [Fulvivirga ulvae]UII31702.1 outer membrane lipoprotein-sorting protein [Fulvivirga ulvae]
MKRMRLMVLALFFVASGAQAQTADEIITNYFENTGGYANWGALKGVKMNFKVNQGGMEIPIEVVQLADGKQYTKVSLQGNDIMQGVYDGNVLWNTNFQTMKAEKADAETTANHKLNTNDFPQDLYNYEKKGYKLELVGNETVEGTETFKIKLVKEPVTVDGEKVDDVVYYFFDKENFVPIAQESEVVSGPQKGIISHISFSDYQEVEGLYFPFSISQGVKDGPSQPITIDAIEINPEVDESSFAFPEGE